MIDMYQTISASPGIAAYRVSFITCSYYYGATILVSSKYSMPMAIFAVLSETLKVKYLCSCFNLNGSEFLSNSMHARNIISVALYSPTTR